MDSGFKSSQQQSLGLGVGSEKSSSQREDRGDQDVLGGESRLGREGSERRIEIEGIESPSSGAQGQDQSQGTQSNVSPSSEKGAASAGTGARSARRRDQLSSENQESAPSDASIESNLSHTPGSA